jgi:hypothetical protein
MIVNFCCMIFIDSVQNWCLDNGMIFNFGETMSISFANKTNIINFNYKLYNSILSYYHCV